MTKVRLVLGVAVVLAFVHSFAFVHSQEQPRPTFKTEVNYVRVDVFPTRDGQPVTDLTAADFEVLEDKVPQKIDAFQHIAVRGNVPQDARREPNNVRESRAMMEDPNARVFVLFLDTYHVEVEGSHNIRKPLVDALDKIIGADDLVGVMTPEMSSGDVTFARKTTTIDGFLTRYWAWGERERINSIDPIEDQYRACYPGMPPPPGCQSDAGIYAAMIDRRREKRTLDALEDLVRFLRGVREERKAVLAISDGWTLFRPDTNLARPICGPPSGPDVTVDPRTGKLSTRAPQNPLGTDASQCERDRQQLSQIDDDRQFKDILDEANRANTSFYPIDPRGLVVFDTPLVPANGPTLLRPAPMVPLGTDQAMLRGRLDSLRTLADATDGLAIINNNDLAGGLKRVVDDLSSYYLLGYYSTGKLDGKFHSITVRVKRPGVQVRARRGFLAATAGEAAASSRGTIPASPEAAAAAIEAHAIDAVVAPLENYSRDLPLRVQAAAGWTSASVPAAAVWLVAELGRAAAASDEWGQGAEADATMTNAAGATVATAHATIANGARSFRATLRPDAGAPPIAPGDYVIRLTVRGLATGAVPSRDTLRVAIAQAPEATGAIVLRRGQSTGNRDVPTADLRFRRGEHIRVEVPAPNASAVSARLLDRMGKPLTLPVIAAVRDDPDGSRWETAQLNLAPLGPGDYVIEMVEGAGRAGGSGAMRKLVAFRMVP
ncbi:MAG TPA: VWA domain-containing protein [Vicinamibacterales bacterium]